MDCAATWEKLAADLLAAEIWYKSLKMNWSIEVSNH